MFSLNWVICMQMSVCVNKSFAVGWCGTWRVFWSSFQDESPTAETKQIKEAIDLIVMIQTIINQIPESEYFFRLWVHKWNGKVSNKKYRTVIVTLKEA